MPFPFDDLGASAGDSFRASDYCVYFGDRRGDAAAALTFPLKLRLLAQSAAGQTHCTGTCRDFFFFLFLVMQSRVIVRFERSSNW